MKHKCKGKEWLSLGPLMFMCEREMVVPSSSKNNCKKKNKKKIMHAWCEGEEKVVFPLQNSVVLMLLVFFFMVLNTVSFNGLIIIIIIIISSIKHLIELIGSLNSNTYFILVIGPLIYFSLQFTLDWINRIPKFQHLFHFSRWFFNSFNFFQIDSKF